MKTKFHFFLAVFFVFQLSVSSQTVKNPFEKTGYKVLMATSSKGEFAEFHDQEDIVEIGSVLYNIRTKEIVEILKKGESTIPSSTVAMSIDPHCERYYWISPYAYAMNNPIKFVDPDGRDVYRFDNKTGEFTLALKNDDKFDQIGKFKHDKKTGEYTLKTNKKGEAKTSMDNIEKGILKDGINFKENDNVIAVGGEGQATVAGVEDFVVRLSDRIDKEISGFEYSAKGGTEPSNVYVGRYQSSKDKSSRWNTANKAYATINPRITGVMPNQIDIHVDFHTHLARFPDSDRLRPSGVSTPGGDMQYKRNQKGNGIKKFVILTSGHLPIEF